MNTVPMSSNEVDAMIRTVAYHRIDFDYTVIWFPNREHATIRTSILSEFRDSVASLELGDFTRVPWEIMREICLEMDIASLFAFRQVSLRGRQIVSSIREYKIIATHALMCICALLRTKSASWVTLSEFYRVLCNELCSICEKSYGNVVHLLNWNRYCSACLRQGRSEIWTIDTELAKSKLKLSDESLGTLRTLRNLPGKYPMNENLFRVSTRYANGRMNLTEESINKLREQSCCLRNLFLMKETIYQSQFELVSAEAALSICTDDQDEAKSFFSKYCIFPKYEFMVCCSLPYYEESRKQIHFGLSCAGCQFAFETGKIIGKLARYRRDMLFSQRIFLEHFQSCEWAQFLWRESDGGMIEPPSLPDFCKEGGDFNLRK